MTTLQFADTHNLITFLARPAESEGFEQIVDFLNAHAIKYALTVNPTIYISCIEQFWATIKAKTINEEVQLQALVVGKNIVVTEASIRSDLQLNDEEDINCLRNTTIFEELTRMGRKRIYVTPSHTKKIFRNMKRVGKGFLRRETPLFPTMVVQNQAEISEDEVVNEEMDDNLERAGTTATGLNAEQDKGNINKTQSKATPNEQSSLRTSSGGGPRHQETMGI
ncbi:hypothetical protein Tco_1452238 [Tanacetum coccineum]